MSSGARVVESVPCAQSVVCARGYDDLAGRRLAHTARHLRNRGRLRVERSPSLLLVLWMIMNPDAPSDRPNANAQPPEPPAASQAAYPSDLAALVLTRWHEATVAGQIDLPPPATSALVDVLSICYKATLLREEGRPVTFRLALSEPNAFAPAAGPPSGLHRLVFARPLPFDEHELRGLASRRRVFPFVGTSPVTAFPRVASIKPGGGPRRPPGAPAVFRTTSAGRRSATWSGPGFRSAWP